jgi:hypothetical protein
LEPLSTFIVKTYVGKEAGVGLYNIGNTIAEEWSVLFVAKEIEYNLERHVKK